MLKANGLTNKEVAQTLHVSERFVYKVNRLYAETLDVSDLPNRKKPRALPRRASTMDAFCNRRIVLCVDNKQMPQTNHWVCR